jgi:hypothetical protein
VEEREIWSSAIYAVVVQRLKWNELLYVCTCIYELGVLVQSETKGSDGKESEVFVLYNHWKNALFCFM